MGHDSGDPTVQFVPLHLEELFGQAGRIGDGQHVVECKKCLRLRIHDVGQTLAGFGMRHAGRVRIDDRVRQLFADVAKRHTLPGFASRVRRAIGRQVQTHIQSLNDFRHVEFALYVCLITCAGDLRRSTRPLRCNTLRIADRAAQRRDRQGQ